MPRRCDLWRIGIVDAPIEDIARAGSLDGFAIDWCEEPGDFRFAADPFAIERNGRLYLFQEAFDYRSRRGRIDVVEIGRDGQRRPSVTAIEEQWHLSYPFLVEDDGALWMLPEASKGGALWLYRSTEFPVRWEKRGRIELDVLPVDATPFRHGDRWWLAYASGASKASAISTLHLAHAARIDGSWTPHPGNPVRVDRGGARPGGTPFLLDGKLILPVQDCEATYGAAIRLLAVEELTPEHLRATLGARLTAPASAGRYRDGLHTLSACGARTLIDVKRIDRSGRGLLIDLKRWWSARRGSRAIVR